MNQKIQELRKLRRVYEEKITEVELASRNGEVLSILDFNDLITELEKVSIFAGDVKAKLQQLKERALVDQRRLDLKYKNRQGDYVSIKKTALLLSFSYYLHILLLKFYPDAAKYREVRHLTLVQLRALKRQQQGNEPLTTCPFQMASFLCPCGEEIGNWDGTVQDVKLCNGCMKRGKKNEEAQATGLRREFRDNRKKKKFPIKSWDLKTWKRKIRGQRFCYLEG